MTELGILAGSLESTRQHLNRLFDALTERNEQLLKTNAELRKQIALAEEANRAKSDFLATMSHELRTPLNAIIGFAEIMRNEMFGPLGHQKYREYALHIDSSGQLLLSLINDILNLTRIERGHAEFAREAFDVGKVVDASLEQVGHLAARRGVKLISNLAPDLPALCTDFRALHQILLNLLSNAIKYSRLEGRVWLECERADGKRVRFLVVDEGIGIPKDMIEKLGVPFQRVGDPLKTNDGGLGLGLSISKTLVGGLGGELRIRSEWGQGTEVSVTLPIDIGASVLRSTELADALSEP